MCRPEGSEPQEVWRTPAIEWSIAAHVAPECQAEAETVSATVPLSTGVLRVVAPFVCKAGTGYTPTASDLAAPGWH